ncbi:MAG: uncharacterized protein H6Q37_2213 [Chloroflexi bacterium]|nr:uncharacterized protein [Chloroflexota bacterium]
MLRIFKVSENSLDPVIREGDFVLTSKIPFLFAHLKFGDIVVFDHPVYGRLIKKIEKISADGEEIFVVGIHELSVDSRQFGPVDRRIILGKVIWHIKQSGR